MKKSFLLSLPGFLLAAAVTGCNNGTATDAASSEPAQPAAAASASIAYFNIDSLVSNYDLYKELSTDFQQKSEKAEKDLSARGRTLERDMLNYQEKVQKGLVTRLQAQELEEQITKKQQSFIQQRDQLLGQLEEEEAVMLNRIQYGISEFLKEFNKDNRYGMILSTNTGGPVMIADPSLDITRELIAGINRYYAENKDRF